MEYLLINRSTLEAWSSSIGWKGEDGTYHLNCDCVRILHAIEEELRKENVTTRNVRLSLGLSHIIERDLVNILETADLGKDISLIRITLRLLVNFTLPPEWLFTSELNSLAASKFSKNHPLNNRLRQLQKILIEAKRAFMKAPKSTALMIKSMKLIPFMGDNSGKFSSFTSRISSERMDFSSILDSRCFQKANSDLNPDDFVDNQMVEDCLFIFRNLLHIPEKIMATSEDSSQPVPVSSSPSATFEEWKGIQQRIIWNLLVQGLDNSLLYLMSTSYSRYWTTHIVQLIALLYRDQPVNKLGQYILSKNFSSDCSEDDIESDHTLSAQRSSSTSILSDSSSSKDSGSHSNNSKHDSGFCQSNNSDKTCSEPSSKDDQSMTEQSTESIAYEKNDTQERKPTIKIAEFAESFMNADVDPIKVSECSDLSMSKPEKVDCGIGQLKGSENLLCGANQVNMKSEKMSIDCEPQEKGFTDQGGENGIVNETDPMGTTNNQTSGFSGSSEEDCERKMHKVMKPHQRSGTKPSESDSSDESDDIRNKMGNRCHHHPHHIKKISSGPKTKVNSSGVTNCHTTSGVANLSNVGMGSGNGVGAAGAETLPSSQSKPYCCPSICMDAAIAAALSRMSANGSSCINSTGQGSNCNTANGNGETKAVAPWDKKSTCGSKRTSIGSESSAPSDNDIRSLLEEFTLKFVHNFFASIVCDLSKDFLSNRGSSIDISHLLWLIGYFLKISNIIDLNFTHLSSILKPDMFGFLVFNGIMLNEELEQLSSNLVGILNPLISKENDSNDEETNNSASPNTTSASSEDFNKDENIRKLVRKIQLLVSALKEMIITVSNYIAKPGLTPDERNFLNELRTSLAKMGDLKQFLLLLIRCHSPLIHPKNLLIDVIVTHHSLLLLLDAPYKIGTFDLASHLNQFATIKIMEQYGRILESFETNSESVNNCVFTMMHHVAGDLRNPECLFQPVILKTFSLIMESDLEILDSWEDLMEYVMSRFVKAATRSNAARLTNLINAEGKIDDEAISVATSTDLTRAATICSSSKSYATDISLVEGTSDFDCSVDYGATSNSDKDQLYWLFLQYEQTSDPISCIKETLMEEHSVEIDRQNLIDQLVSRGLINQANASKYLENSLNHSKPKKIIDSAKMNQDETQEFHIERPTSLNGSENNVQHSQVSDDSQGEMREIDLLIDRVGKLGLNEQLSWISNLLVDVCNAKMFQIKQTIPHGRSLQPIAFYSELLGHSMPVVPYTEKQEVAMNSKPMLELLRRIGFLLPGDIGKLYARIPAYFTPDIIYRIANKLAQIDPGTLFFKLDDILETGKNFA